MLHFFEIVKRFKPPVRIMAFCLGYYVFFSFLYHSKFVQRCYRYCLFHILCKYSSQICLILFFLWDFSIQTNMFYFSCFNVLSSWNFGGGSCWRSKLLIVIPTDISWKIISKRKGWPLPCVNFDENPILTRGSWPIAGYG